MSVLPNQLWGEASAYTWLGINPNQWLDFRLAMSDTEVEQLVQGVKLVASGSNIASESLVKVQGITIEHSKFELQTETEMVSSVVVSDRDYLSKMIKYLPLYERKSNVYKAILKVVDRELRGIEQQKNVAERNMFIDTSIEDLSLYERDLAIKTQLNLKYDQRREQISARTRAAFDQTTLTTIKSVASAFSNGEVDIHKTAIAGVYECEFIGTIGIPNNMEGLQEAIDLIMPAHLEMTYKYNFQIWSKWNQKQWSTINTLTWNDLRTRGMI